MRVAVETKDDRILSINTLTNAISLEDDKDGYWEISLDYAIEHFFEEFQELMSKMNIQLNYIESVREVEEEKHKMPKDDVMIVIYPRDVKCFAYDYVKNQKYWNSEEDPTHDILDYTEQLLIKLANK